MGAARRDLITRQRPTGSLRASIRDSLTFLYPRCCGTRFCAAWKRSGETDTSPMPLLKGSVWDLERPNFRRGHPQVESAMEAPKSFLDR